MLQYTASFFQHGHFFWGGGGIDLYLGYIGKWIIPLDSVDKEFLPQNTPPPQV